jgi:hypothetical protein
MYRYAITLEHQSEIFTIDTNADNEQDAIDLALAINGLDCEVIGVFQYPELEE